MLKRLIMLFRLPLEGRPTIFRRKISGGGRGDSANAIPAELHDAICAGLYEEIERERIKAREARKLAKDWEMAAVVATRELRRVNR